MRLRISSRKSDLARLQSLRVGAALQEKYADLKIDYRFKESLGDINLEDPLWKIPEKGVFTEDFYQELKSGETDMIVHSWKDLPTETKPDTEIFATLPRADQRDILLIKKINLEKIIKTRSVKIYSSSPRRSYNLTPFLKEALPLGVDQVEFTSVRGNIPTRIRKLIESHDTDGLIVAKAALDRLLSAPESEFLETQTQMRFHLEQTQWMVLPLSVNPNAAAQGSLAIEICSDRDDLKKILSSINDPDTFTRSVEERKILKTYGGGCHQKIGVAAISTSHGTVLSVKGLTDQGEVLNTFNLKNTRPVPQFQSDEVWSAHLSKKNYFHRTSIEAPLELESILVSKFNAWNSNIKAKFVWTAGLTTWKKLASQGIWVHGTNDSLGENIAPDINILAKKNLQWIKITHAEAPHQDNQIATYKINRNENKFDFQNKKFFYWSSYSLFQNAIQEFPEIIDNYHACGLGISFDYISKKLDEHLGSHQKLFAFTSEEDWSQHVIN